MGLTSVHVAILALQGLVSASCPFADPANLHARAAGSPQTPISDAVVDDSSGYLTTDVGGQISDQDSLRAGDRGPTLLEDFIFRQKITRFDHERVGHQKHCRSLPGCSLASLILLGFVNMLGRSQSALSTHEALELMALSQATLTGAMSPPPRS
jgi:hypothetical protein